MGSLPGTPAPLDCRAAGLAIDLSVYSLLAAAIVAIGDVPQAPQDPWMRWGVCVGLALLYWIGCAYRWNTFGKWFVGLRLADCDGRPPSLEKCLKRSLFPGVVWIWSILWMPGLGWSEPLRRAESWPGLSTPMLAIPFIWGVTAKLVVPPDQSSYYNDRLSGTMFVRCPGNVWFLNWIGHVTWAGVRFVKESVYRKGRWVYETIAPLSLDIRRLVAWGIDLLLLWTAYVVLEEGQGPFAHSGSWYFVFLVVAAVVLWVLPAYGFSPGKALLDVRIVNEHGQPPGLRAAFARAAVPGTIWVVLLLVAPQRALLPGTSWIESVLWLALAVSIALAILDIATYLGDPYQRGLRDLVAGTYVVDANPLFGVRGKPRPLPDDIHWQLVATAPERKPHRGEPPTGLDEDGCVQRRIVGVVLDVALVWCFLVANEALLAGYEHLDLRLLVWTVFLIGYFVGLVAMGNTPGGWLAGVRIVSASNGASPGFTRALVRFLPFFTLLILLVFDSSRVAYYYEANELVMMVRDLVLLALLFVIALDVVFITLLQRGEPMHNLISDTAVECCAESSWRAALGTWFTEKWRWLNGDEPSAMPAARIRDP